MKPLVAPVIALVAGLMAFPALFANGDAHHLGCTGDAHLDAILATIRSLESGGDYTAQARGSTASGAYQFIDSTWAGYDGYPRAWQAPPHVQDAKAAEHVTDILERHHGDVAAVPVVWYLGHLPAPDSSRWDTVPFPAAGNVLTPRQYQTRWLTEYERQLASLLGDDVDPDAPRISPCAPGAPIDALVDGFAPPGPPELFATADVNAPHHTYPAWDWMIPTGTPIYAVRGGTVASTQYWPHNWWDHGCGTNPTGCRTCGIGLTITDDDGNRWAYCHATALHVHLGATVPAGTHIMTSGNTGRSGAPHLHLQIRTTDGQLRCPQRLLRAIRDQGHGLDPHTLPIEGCFF